MSKTAFLTKCSILGFLWENYRQDIVGNETWEKFFSWADVGLPLAYMQNEGIATISADGKQYILDTWDTFCFILDIDAEDRYKDLEDCFNKSPHTPVEDLADE